MVASEIANDLDDRPPPVPIIGQVNAMIKHVNLRKATGVDSVHVWLLKWFVDFRKAVDLVDHGVLLTKLACMRVTKSFWKWTQSYLSGRMQQVKLPGVLSRHGEVIAVVPQGGVISPTLFNVHVNNNY